MLCGLPSAVFLAGLRMPGEFNLNSASGKKPGAIATVGAGSLAMGVALGDAGDKKGTVQADASQMAKAVAKQRSFHDQPKLDFCSFPRDHQPGLRRRTSPHSGPARGQNNRWGPRPPDAKRTFGR